MHVFPYKIKRILLVRLPYGEDLLSAIERMTTEEQVTPAIFSVIGAVRNTAFGYYDQINRTYQKLLRAGGFEIISCAGNVSIKEGKTLVHAHILFGDEQGKCFGGHLMSPTTIFAAELHLLELEGELLVREYDATTGLYLWG
jgi:predicted DNA-binding protein with PD1-like motif